MKRLKPSSLINFVYRPIELVSDTLERKLGMASVVIISLSAMLGSGLFVLPALAMLDMGGGTTPVAGIWLAYLVAALIVLPGALSKGELATAMPSSGGSYVYVERTFGPLFGTIAGLGLWANFMLKSAFALIGFKAYLVVLESILGISIDIEIAALILLAMIVGINILGLKRIKKVQTPIVLISVIFLFMLCMWAIFTMDLDWGVPFSKAAFGSGWQSVAQTSAFVFVAYAGVTKIAAVGGEIKNPSRNIPYGIIISLIISCLLYVSISIVMVATLDPSGYMDGNKASEDPIYIFAKEVGGSTIGVIAAILAITTMTSMALAGIMASSRFPFAMARDNLLPEALENVHPKYQTPHLSILLTGIAMAAAITWLPVHDIAKLASGFKIMIFIVINMCVIVLRRASKTHSWYNPDWKSPLYPYVQMFGIIGGFILIYLMGSKAIIGATACCIMGLLIYYTYGKSRANPTLTPWRTVRTEFTNSDKHEREKRWLVFHTAAAKHSHPDCLNEGEFVHAMSIIAPQYDSFHVRNMFHEIDTNADGVIDVDEFLEGIEEQIDEQE
ncbi:MAG: amino acid permease [Candidatus Thalassarchaeaceae archaeon]|jgi:amino acid transporter|nr:amino acid permease [Candidatus Thalassarchaeaceae archaeon]